MSHPVPIIHLFPNRSMSLTMASGCQFRTFKQRGAARSGQSFFDIHRYLPPGAKCSSGTSCLLSSPNTLSAMAAGALMMGWTDSGRLSSVFSSFHVPIVTGSIAAANRTASLTSLGALATAITLTPLLAMIKVERSHTVYSSCYAVTLAEQRKKTTATRLGGDGFLCCGRQVRRCTFVHVLAFFFFSLVYKRIGGRVRSTPQPIILPA